MNPFLPNAPATYQPFSQKKIPAFRLDMPGCILDRGAFHSGTKYLEASQILLRVTKILRFALKLQKHLRHLFASFPQISTVFPEFPHRQLKTKVFRLHSLSAQFDLMILLRSWIFSKEKKKMRKTTYSAGKNSGLLKPEQTV